MIKLMVAIFSAFLIFLIIHALHFHYFDPFNRVNSVIGAAVLGYFFFFPLYYFLPDDSVIAGRLRIPYEKIKKCVPLFLGTILFVLLFIGYLEFYFTADRSITFRMLRITDERPTQSITADEMLGAYDTQGIIIRRLDDLVYGGYLKKEGDHYKLTPKGQFILAIYRQTIDFMHMQKF